MLDSSGSTGLIITLQSDRWTSISQQFIPRHGEGGLRVNYKLSPDFQTTPFSPAQLLDGISTVLGFRPKNFLTEESMQAILSQPGWTADKWTIAVSVVVDLPKQLAYDCNMIPRKDDKELLVSSVQIPGDQEDSKVLYLFFPPGKGSITLTKVAIASTPQPLAPPSQTPSNPFQK